MIADFTEDQIRDFVIIWLEHGLQLQAEAQRKRLNPHGGACLVRMQKVGRCVKACHVAMLTPSAAMLTMA